MQNTRREMIHKYGPLLHVGYRVIIPPTELEARLMPLMGREFEPYLDKEPYTCALFKEHHTEMESWMRKREGKLAQGVIYGLYVEKTKQVAVAEVRLGPQPYYLIVAARVRIPHQDLKRLANSGELGPRVAIEPPMPIDAYAHAEFR